MNSLHLRAILEETTMAELHPAIRNRILSKITDLLQADKVPFRNVIFLSKGDLADIVEIPDGWEKGTLTINWEESTITANLTWTYYDANDDDGD